MLELEEEHPFLYVAMTRAKDNLVPQRFFTMGRVSRAIGMSMPSRTRFRRPRLLWPSRVLAGRGQCVSKTA